MSSVSDDFDALMYHLIGMPEVIIPDFLARFSIITGCSFRVGYGQRDYHLFCMIPVGDRKENITFVIDLDEIFRDDGETVLSLVVEREVFDEAFKNDGLPLLYSLKNASDILKNLYQFGLITLSEWNKYA